MNQRRRQAWWAVGILLGAFALGCGGDVERRPVAKIGPGLKTLPGGTLRLEDEEAAPPAATAAEPQSHPPRAPIYDEKADARAQIAAALETARQENKRVLVEFGGNWCGWCYKLYDVFHNDPEVAPLVRDACNGSIRRRRHPAARPLRQRRSTGHGYFALGDSARLPRSRWSPRPPFRSAGLSASRIIPNSNTVSCGRLWLCWSVPSGRCSRIIRKMRRACAICPDGKRRSLSRHFPIPCRRALKIGSRLLSSGSRLLRA